jgi:hypothetical protein
MKVREVLGVWPPGQWAADDGNGNGLAPDASKLQLLWFSTPDADGWFRLTAVDSTAASWSTYCRTTDGQWRALDRALAASLRQPLELVGNVELDTSAEPRR